MPEDAPRTHEIAFTASGRLLADAAATTAGDGPILLGLHGYGARADHLYRQLRPLATATGLRLACPEAPHCFYRQAGHGRVGCSWLTSHRREALIAANERWLAACIGRLDGDQAARLIVVGMSQGASQAWRLAWTRDDLLAVVAVGGDLPPEYHGQPLPESPAPALIVRGDQDAIYDADRLQRDQDALTAIGWPHETVTVAGGHEITDGVRAAIASWLAVHKIASME